MTIKIYLDYISQPSRAVLAFCKISHIHVQLFEIRIAKMQHYSEQFATINPMKKVPALVDSDNNISLGESHAIIEYLIAKFNLSDVWFPKNDIILRAKVQEYSHFHHTNTRKCAMLLFAQLFSKLYSVQGQNLIGSDVAQQVKNVLDFIQIHYYKNSEYLIGNSLTYADLSAFFQIQSLELLDFDMKAWPKITKWMSKIGSISQVHEVNAAFRKTLPKMKKLKAAL